MPGKNGNGDIDEVDDGLIDRREAIRGEASGTGKKRVDWSWWPGVFVAKGRKKGGRSMDEIEWGRPLSWLSLFSQFCVPVTLAPLQNFLASHGSTWSNEPGMTLHFPL